MLHGIDVSHWQDPDKIDWAKLRETHEFVICRATYGTCIDREVERHVRYARREAFSIGLYAFYRPHEPVEEQYAAFQSVDESCGYEPGDIVPGQDIEDDLFAPPEWKRVSTRWNDGARDFSEALVEEYGNSSCYITQRAWVQLGRPKWVLDRVLWVAHWTNQPEPATPGDASWDIWQHRVGCLAGVYRGDLDQDMARELVLIPHDGPLGMTRGEVERVMGHIALTAMQSYHDLDE